MLYRTWSCSIAAAGDWSLIASSNTISAIDFDAGNCFFKASKLSRDSSVWPIRTRLLVRHIQNNSNRFWRYQRGHSNVICVRTLFMRQSRSVRFVRTASCCVRFSLSDSTSASMFFKRLNESNTSRSLRIVTMLFEATTPTARLRSLQSHNQGKSQQIGQPH